MKAYVTEQPRQLTLTEVDEPQAGPGQVLLQVRAVGICGSDHHIYLGHHPYAKLPMVQGHEFCATILAYGSDCKRSLPVGSQVVIEPLLRCGACYACQQGRYNCCESLAIFGVHRPGAFQERVVVPEYLMHAADGVLPQVATFAEPLSIAVQAAKRGRIVADDIVLILGAGPIGLATVLACKDLGAKVAISDVMASRLEKARALGADFVFNPAHDDPQAIRAWSGGGVTAVIDAVAVEPAIKLGVDALRAAGRYVLVGMSGKNLPIPISTVVAKEIDIIGSRNSSNVFADAVALLQRNIGKVERIISISHGLDTLPAMMDYSIEHPQDVEKMVVVL
ncbi:alcohol dehydrogenase catalytic domain-containing protein [Burkholderia sp. Ac-20379]|uniref:alcohol dehydrogenase catalytic domain-containing protein n=1 Tax=Burkholderia sp. Ac-20379 TaxID=2703900 RepID=UPI0019824A4E|nr:alcohol dehydrogenase catalytic domain-containing protein [Burkholderia sp. Ac-20379]MBN3725214.1 alcohol dehydrogenase catalytic domain-containing protein [Burkholderia sp. Ac-20379]